MTNTLSTRRARRPRRRFERKFTDPRGPISRPEPTPKKDQRNALPTALEVGNDPHIKDTTLKVGDIYCTSWGYEQTRVYFYQITRLTAKSVWYKPMTKKACPGGDYNNWQVLPDQLLTSKKEKMARRKGPDSSGYEYFWVGRELADKWLGEPENESGYH